MLRGAVLREVVVVIPPPRVAPYGKKCSHRKRSLKTKTSSASRKDTEDENKPVVPPQFTACAAS